MPDAIENATYSTWHTGKTIADLTTSPSRDILRTMLNASLGLTDLTEDEWRNIESHDRNPYALDRDLADALSRRAQIGWSTSGHSVRLPLYLCRGRKKMMIAQGVDVNLYAYGYQASTLRGSRENTEVRRCGQARMFFAFSQSHRSALLSNASWTSIWSRRLESSDSTPKRGIAPKRYKRPMPHLTASFITITAGPSVLQRD